MVVIVVLSVVAVYLLYLVRGPIGQLALALFLAVAVTGPVASLSRHMKKGYAITIVYLALVITPIVIGVVLVRPVIRQTVELVANLPEYADKLEKRMSENPELQEINEEYDISGKLKEHADDLVASVGDAAGAIASFGASVISSIFSLVTILVLSMFMVARGRRWIDAVLALRPPEQAAATRRALDGMSKAVGGYIGGALVQAIVAGVAAWLMLVILGVPSPLPLALLMALFDLIPLVGATIGAVIVGVVILFSGSAVDVLIWAIFAIAYQQFENYVVQPRIQSRASSLDPFIVVIAAIFGGALAGILGALLAIPVAAAIAVAVREFVAFRWPDRNILQQPPEPDPEPEPT